MSTKSTISYDKGYHLYAECFDENLVYLRLDDPIMLKADFWEGSKSSVTVALSKEDMLQLCKEFVTKYNYYYGESEE